MSRPFFPAQKRVSFRTPLEEEIQTTKYTVAHVELFSPEPEPEMIDLDSASPPEETESVLSETTEAVSTTAPRRRGAKRDSWSDDDDSDSAPETPKAGRSKRRREWVWTIPDPLRPKAETTDSES
jgi:hypothetical protein